MSLSQKEIALIKNGALTNYIEINLSRNVYCCCSVYVYNVYSEI